jgi:uncharacterized protein
MLKQVKIFNDPVYGFISVPKGILLDVLDHPYYQRLRRISQTALTYYVYPGAHHTRFHHALGALHLMMQTIEVLRQKGVEITDAEAEGVSLAILMHDIGHGPFSHALEGSLVDVHHEEISLLFMEELNRVFDGKLELAILIFTNKYSKHFLNQLVSGQLDMDRLDYLNRDSFFTGVSEGVIGYDRIIKMLNVVDGELVVEEKGIYSIEKFLIARRLMYWQVYLHKTVLSAEQMLIRVLKRAKFLHNQGVDLEMSKGLKVFFDNEFSLKNEENRKQLPQYFAVLDDFDIIAALKTWTDENDFILSFLSNGILNRKLLKLKFQDKPFDKATIEHFKSEARAHVPSGTPVEYLVFTGSESNQTYNNQKDEIKILFKTGEVRSITSSMDYALDSKIIRKNYLCYPKYF